MDVMDSYLITAVGLLKKHPNTTDNQSNSTKQEITAFMKTKRDFLDGI